MSTLRVNAIQNSTGGDLINARGMAAAWVNFNGTGTVSIRQAFNVSSITDNGVGDYTLNFTSAMVDANISLAGAASRSVAGTRGTIVDMNPSSPLSSTSARIRSVTVDTNPTPADCEFITVQVFD